MSKLQSLQQATTKRELAGLLGVKTSVLTYSLYILKPDTQYYQFKKPKKNGGERVISAPSGKLKSLQSGLSNLLLDCIDEINEKKFTSQNIKKPALSHGFVREKSIITNAMMHLNQKRVLNIDLDNYFDSFNFGRVRGFFIKNNNFNINEDIATVIAQIACYNNALPQGSPCSPVITNLITHSLDIRLASLAKKYSCTYSRYADDITFSTRKVEFPEQIMLESKGDYTPGRKLFGAIKQAGFSINNKKTRIQYKDSRQDVTGLIVNKKPNVKSEYWRIVKSQCNNLFHTGEFVVKVNDIEEKGSINKLDGRLNFIDQVDRFNRLRQKPALNPVYAISKHGYNTTSQLSGREKTFSRFLYYRLFYANAEPTILCEGKTDNVYLKSAISELVNTYPVLATPKSQGQQYKLLIRFIEYSKRTRFLLELFGGTSYLAYFIGKFDRHFQFYKAPKPQHPVIMILDNDKGPKDLLNKVVQLDSAVVYPITVPKNNIRDAEYIHVMHNLYIVLTPKLAGNPTEIEDLFDLATRQIQVSNKSFNPKKDFDKATEYGKEIFANKVIKANKRNVNFDGLKPVLNRVVAAITHYDSIK
jgi:RNA-directed DNA polymerase